MRYLLLLFCLPGLWACSSKTTSENNDTAATQNTETAAPVATEEKQPAERPVILCFGNSLTAGYGLENVDDAFPFLIQRKIDSLGLDYAVVNAGLSGETTAGGLNRLPWLLRQPVAVLMIELGANDGLRGIPAAETRANLLAMIDVAREKAPDAKILLCGMLVPPNMGPDYAREFEAVFPEVAQEKDVNYLPFLLDGVAGEPHLNQEDGIHPTVEGQLIVARNVWGALKPLLSDS